MQHGSNPDGKPTPLKCTEDGVQHVFLVNGGSTGGGMPPPPPIVHFPDLLSVFAKFESNGGATAFSTPTSLGSRVHLTPRNAQVHSIELQSLVHEQTLVKFYDCSKAKRSKSLRGCPGIAPEESDFEKTHESLTGSDRSVLSFMLKPLEFRQLTFPAGIQFAHGVAVTCSAKNNDDPSAGAVFVSCTATVP